MRVCAIDCGSNSFHLLIADIERQDQFSIIADDKSLLYLGAEVASTGQISQATLLRAKRVIRHYKTLIQRHDVDEIRCVATSAIRSASNGSEIIASLSKTLGSKIKVISGKLEAQIIYRGIRAVSSLPESNVLNIDMGGGSLELMVGKDSQLQYAQSEPLGASRLAKELEVSDPLTKSDIENIEKQCDRYFLDFKEHYPKENFGNIVVSSGTLNTLISMARARIDGFESVSNSNISATRKEMKDLCDLVISSKAKERKKLLGCDTTREEFIQTAAVIAKKIQTLVDKDSPWYSSPYALREGLVLQVGDELLKNNLSTSSEVKNATVTKIERNVHALAGVDKKILGTKTKTELHNEKVLENCVKLFKSLKDIHGLSKNDLEILKFGVRLHNVGQTISREKYDTHGAYILFNTALPGFSANEATMLRSLVRCHRTRNPRISDNLVGRLSEEDLFKVRWLVAILRIGDASDHGRTQVVEKINVTVNPDNIYVYLVSKHDVELEVYSVRRRRGLLEELSSRDVIVSAVSP